MKKIRKIIGTPIMVLGLFLAMLGAVIADSDFAFLLKELRNKK